MAHLITARHLTPPPLRSAVGAARAPPLTSHAKVYGVQAGGVHLNNDLVGVLNDGEHHVPGEAQHLVAAVPVDDPRGHGGPRPRRDAEAAHRRPLPAPPRRPAQRSPCQHGRQRAPPPPRPGL